MDERTDIGQQLSGERADLMPEASAGPSVPVEGEMPMLAGSAAARLTQQILARLSTPHAAPLASPLRPGALWRQVTRRLGVLSDEKSRPGPGRQLLPAVQAQAESRAGQGPFAPPPTQLVWRVASPARREHTEEAGVEDQLASALRPSTRTIPSATPQAAPSVVAPPAVPVATTSAPAAMSASHQPVVQPSLAEGVQAPAPPSPQVADSTPPAPAKTVRVEYVQGPALLPVQPLVSHAPLIETSSYTPHNIAGSLNLDLVTTTDMISRMLRPSWEDLPLTEARQKAQATATATASEQSPSPQAMQPEQPALYVVQAPPLSVEEGPRLEMPLVATPATPQRVPSSTVEETLERAARSPVRQLIDRVASALPLPEAVRRFITGEPAQTEKQPAPSLAETPVQATLAPEREALSTSTSIPSPTPPSVTTASAPAQPAASATVGGQQPSTPALAARAERVSQEIVSAPSPVSAPSALEMPVRAPIAPASAARQDAISQQVQSPSSPLGPFQPFQTSIPAQPEPATQARPAQQVRQSQEPPVERAVQLQPIQRQESQPLGPFEPFQPVQSVQSAQSAIAEQARPATELLPSTPQSTTPVVPSVVEPLLEASPSISTSPDTQAQVAVPDVGARRAVPYTYQAREEVAQAPAGEEAPAVAPVARETAVGHEPGARGFLGSFLDRLFGRGERTEAEERDEARPTAIEMPWVRQGRSPQSQPDEARSTGAEDVELPSTRLAEPERQAPQGVSPASATPALAGTPSIIAEAPPPPTALPSSQPAVPVQAAIEAGSAPPVSIGGRAPEIATQRALEAPQAGQVTGGEADPPDLPRVVERGTFAGQPSPLDMPHAAQPGQTDLPVASESADEVIQRATLPSETFARPSIETPAATQALPLAAEPALVPTSPEAVQPTQPEAEPQAWTFMPDVADSLVRSHAPLSTVQPMETAVQSDLLARILGSLGHEIGATSDDLPRAVPAPMTGVGTDQPVARPAGPAQTEGTIAAPVPIAGPTPVSSTSAPMGAPIPVGLPATPIVGGAQTLRDMGTVASQSIAPESQNRVASSGEATSAAPGPISMPTRYITNVTPALYGTETPIANIPAESGLSDIGTIMRPASHMSPSMGDYGWPGSDGSPTNPTLMLPLSEMSPTADSFAQSEGGSGEESQPQQQEQPPWMAALQSLYGQQKGNDDMPLAVPYGAFAVPSDSTSTWQAPGFGQSLPTSPPARAASDGFSPMAMPTPSIPYFGSGSSTQSSSFATGAAPSWGTNSVGSSDFSSWGTDSYSEGDSEAGAWADVVTSAVSSDSGSSPALALAGEERSSSSDSASTDEPENSHEGGSSGPDLDELAESVLDIIRHKLLIERERSFG